MPTSDITLQAASLFELIEKPFDGFRVRVRAASAKRVALETVGPDQPFILDSLLELLRVRGHQTAEVLHPIVAVERSASGNVIAVGPARSGAELVSVIRIELAEPIAATEREALAFLDWLRRANFVFLGYRGYDLKGSGKQTTVEIEHRSGLDILCDETTSTFAKPKLLSALMPILTNLGLNVLDEQSFRVTPSGGEIYLHSSPCPSRSLPSSSSLVPWDAMQPSRNSRREEGHGCLNGGDCRRRRLSCLLVEIDTLSGPSN